MYILNFKSNGFLSLMQRFKDEFYGDKKSLVILFITYEF